jgi:predicted P-loop ATPase
MIQLPEIQFFHKQGMAIHWLKPRSKAPLNAGWTKGPRADWNDLAKSYRKDLNVGVRLGVSSKFSNGYLAVIDLDVKSEDLKHRKEAEKALLNLYPTAKNAPKVISGRGNGSAHYYVLTKEPTKGGDTKAKSTEIVKVKMPSVDPSKKELEVLSMDEVGDGYRLRPAWEISLLSEGRQVVLPPSIHPDSNRPYQWERQFDLRTLPVINDVKAAAKVDAPKVSESKINVVEFDLDTLNLYPEQLAALKDGDGVEDRSAYCFGLCMALVQREISDNTILSILTDRSLYLGATGFDHAKTTDRAKAWRWVEKYCLAKAKRQVEENKNVFEDLEVEGIEDKGDWIKQLDKTLPTKFSGPKIKPTFKNIKLILVNEIGPELLKHNAFTHDDFFGLDTPWGYQAGRKRSAGVEDAIAVKDWLIENWKFEPALSLIEEVFKHITSFNSFHPVKDLLESLEWDGVTRVETAFLRYLGADMPEAYLKQVTRKFFIALIKRIYQPGCKFDHIPVLEGEQGIGKSTFGRILVGDEWFLDGLPELSDKDAALNLQGIWLCEMGELSSIYKSQIEITKAFITRQTDKLRPPYGHRRVDFPRANVFLGTTNSKDYLNDHSGNRRYWPVHVNKCDFKALAKDRLQLLAEAKFLYDFCNEPLWLTGEAAKEAILIQDSRRAEDEIDAITSLIKNALEDGEDAFDKEKISLEGLFDTVLFNYPKNQRNRNAAAHALRKLGYERKHTYLGKRWVLDRPKILN